MQHSGRDCGAVLLSCGRLRAVLVAPDRAQSLWTLMCADGAYSDAGDLRCRNPRTPARDLLQRAVASRAIGRQRRAVPCYRL